jgi:hypothetical protein
MRCCSCDVQCRVFRLRLSPAIDEAEYCGFQWVQWVQWVYHNGTVSRRAKTETIHPPFESVRPLVHHHPRQRQARTMAPQNHAPTSAAHRTSQPARGPRVETKINFKHITAVTRTQAVGVPPPSPTPFHRKPSQFAILCRRVPQPSRASCNFFSSEQCKLHRRFPTTMRFAAAARR